MYQNSQQLQGQHLEYFKRDRQLAVETLAVTPIGKVD